jgi:similar to stage IV sporulation protein
MFIGVLRYLSGLVDFEITAPDIENLAKEIAGVGKIYGLYCKGIKLYGRCSISTYKRMTPILKKRHARRKALRREGLRFEIHKRKKRIGFPAGIISAVLLLFILSRFIWVIEIKGEDEALREKLSENLHLYGIGVGKIRSSLNSKQIENEILADFPEIGFIALNISGARLEIEIDKAIKKPIDETRGEYGNIIAKKGGKIKAPYVYNGVSLIKEGDHVFEGELLVSGTREDYFGRTIFLNSSADIYAETENEITIKLPKVIYKETETGQIFKRRYLSVFDLKIPLHFNLFLKGDFKEDIKSENLYIKGQKLPLCFTEITLYKVEKEVVERTLEELKDEALALLEKEFASFTDKKDITLLETVFSENDDEIILTARYKATENIAKYIPFEVN